MQHRLLAAKQMRTARYVEKKPVIAVDRDKRRVAIAPVGQPVEKPGIGFLVRLYYLYRGVHCARIGNAHAAFQAQRLGMLVERENALRIAFAMADGDRRHVGERPRLAPAPRLMPPP
ncbi:MAG: hypothetical protein Rhirs2KO_36790 [Rhizobiaceae bacterium]